METKELKKGSKAIWNYSRNHYADETSIKRDGMEVIILDIYSNGFCSIHFSENGITSCLLSELTAI